MRSKGKEHGQMMERSKNPDSSSSARSSITVHIPSLAFAATLPANLAAKAGRSGAFDKGSGTFTW